jgi:hypothetical protein
MAKPEQPSLERSGSIRSLAESIKANPIERCVSGDMSDLSTRSERGRGRSRTARSTSGDFDNAVDDLMKARRLRGDSVSRSRARQVEAEEEHEKSLLGQFGHLMDGTMKTATFAVNTVAGSSALLLDGTMKAGTGLVTGSMKAGTGLAKGSMNVANKTVGVASKAVLSGAKGVTKGTTGVVAGTMKAGTGLVNTVTGLPSHVAKLPSHRVNYGDLNY